MSQEHPQINILYIIHTPTPYGSNVALINLIDELRPMGINPMVVSSVDGVLREWLQKRDIPFKLVKYRFQIYPKLGNLINYLTFLPKFRFLLKNRIAKIKLEKIIKEFNPSVIHTNIGPAHIGFEVAAKLNIPHIWHIREYQDKDFNFHPYPSMQSFKNKIKKSYLIAITKGLANYFEMPAKTSKVIYDGVMSVNESRFNPDKEKYFLFTGNLQEGKGIRVLIKAFVEFAKSNDEYILQIAGNGEAAYVNELEKIVAKANLAHRVIFLGFRTDRYNLMSRATALVVPSLYEGFGFTTAEALFNGCLVIGNNTAGTKEILDQEEGNFGLLYNGHNELVAAINMVIAKGIEYYFPTIKKAQQNALMLYSTEQHGKKVYEYYHEILKNKTHG
jgi:glycosyltransferase involved in cell wall biosynthesis